MTSKSALSSSKSSAVQNHEQFNYQTIMTATHFINECAIIMSNPLKLAESPGENEPFELDMRGDLTLRVGTPEPSTPKSFRVCSRTLARVSPVFDRMLFGRFAESKKESSAEWIVELPEDKPGPLGLLLCIAHCRFSQVPRELSISALYDISVTAHYYDATKILMPWADHWISSISESIGNVHHRLLRMLWIAWEFGRKDLFEEAAQRLVMEAPGTFFSSDAPWADLQMPPDIIERISAIRFQTMQSLLDTTKEITDRLVVVDERPRWCCHASYMGPHRCLWPIPEAGDIDSLSVLQLQSTLMNLVIHDIGRASEVDHKVCNPQNFLEGQVRRIVAEVPDPVLESHRKHMEEQVIKLRT